MWHLAYLLTSSSDKHPRLGLLKSKRQKYPNISQTSRTLAHTRNEITKGLNSLPKSSIRHPAD
jgi:hypothetical protein